MKAIIFNKKNRKKERLVYSDTAMPNITKDNELLIKIHATSVNAADYRMIKMGITPKSKIFGADISGVVESVGKNVTKFKTGDEVIGDLSNNGFGGFAEYAIATEELLVVKPKSISFENGAALPLAAVTALQALQTMANVKKGQKVLIVGSSGGVGTYVLQLAKHFGAIVTSVCSSKNTEQMLQLGADKVIDYTKENFFNEIGFYDVIIAVNGNYPLLKYKKCLNKNGKCVFIGGSMFQIVKALIFCRLLSFGSKKMGILSAKSNKNDLKFIAELTEKGIVKPYIEKIYPLSETVQAIQHVTQGHAKGKIVIKVI